MPAFPKLCSAEHLRCVSFKVFCEFPQSLTLLLPNSQNANADRLPNFHFAKINLCKCLADWKFAFMRRQIILRHNKLFSRSICRWKIGNFKPVVPNRCPATSTLVCRESMPLRHQTFCLAFWLFLGLNFLASKWKVAMILGRKLRNH